MTIYDQMAEALRQVTPPDAFYQKSNANVRKLLTMEDRFGRDPGIFILMSNRIGGKTYPVTQMLVKMHELFGTRVVLQVRWGEEIPQYATGLFRDVLANDPQFEGWFVTESVIKENKLSAFFLHMSQEDEGTFFGYVVALNSAYRMKKLTPQMEPCDIVFQDEFLDPPFCSMETRKWTQMRFNLRRKRQKMPIIMCANSIDILNDYFLMWGISLELNDDTKFFRGNGIVLSRFVNKEVQEEFEQDPVIRACMGSDEVKSSLGNEWLNSDRVGVEKPGKWGRSMYFCTIFDDTVTMGVRYYPESDIYYISRSVDYTCNVRFTIRVSGMVDIPLLRKSNALSVLRDSFGKGQVRFSDIIVKKAVADFLIR